MINTLVVTTGNAHKLSEIQTLFSDLELNVISMKDAFDDIPEIIEDGDTFEENAIKKVSPFSNQAGIILMGEDSGLEVEALDGRPGIYSARYKGDDATSEMQCKGILEELENKPNRKANFTCSVALKLPNGDIKTIEEKVFGTIADSIKGHNGFGYDPIFIPEGYNETFGELSESIKKRLSHRAKAMNRVRKLLSRI